MDQGIIENVKRRYKFLFLRSILFAQKSEISLPAYLKTINIKDVIFWISDAWAGVSKEIIFKCWKQLLPDYFYDKNDDTNFNENHTNQELTTVIRQIHSYEYADENSITNWIDSNDTEPSTIPSNSELIRMVTKHEKEGKVSNNLFSKLNYVLTILINFY